MMGSGGMVVLDEDDCMVEVARYFLDFTQKESCGKCTLCRLGNKADVRYPGGYHEGPRKDGRPRRHSKNWQRISRWDLSAAWEEQHPIRCSRP